MKLALGSVALSFALVAGCGSDETSFCDPDPCLNGATCGEGADGPVCACTAGFEGALCEIDHDDCAGAPCLNGGTCADGIDAFTCTCAAGFEGATCATNIDDCASAPCLNGGTCLDGVDAYTCACGAQFEGDRCQCAISAPVVVNYANRGTSTTTTIDDTPPGVVVTGSGTIHILNLNGLAVVGGASDNTVDGSESLTFALANPALAVSYFVPFGGNLDGDGLVGEASIEAFGSAGTSLGVHAVSGGGEIDVTALFAGARIRRFVVTADGDSFRLGSVTVRPVVCP